MKRALIVYGGWAGHQPERFALRTRAHLEGEGYDVRLADRLEVFDEAQQLAGYDLIVPIWSMGELTPAQERNLLGAIEAGCGLAGWHGGMGDAFRPNLGYKMMVGGQFVAHPGDILRYTVAIADRADPITEGIDDFAVVSEQYYLHVDPSNHVLATTTFSGEAMPWLDGVVMPVVWKRRWGKGKVFYSSLGHAPEEFDIPEVWALTTRGLAWATRAGA
jgi:type 1 glutamine amidotransferase